MPKSYFKPLNVSDTKGKRMVAKVILVNKGQRLISLPYIKEVDKDTTKVFKKGKVKVLTDSKSYAEAISRIEKYLETLFMKELSNDNIHSSNRTKAKSGRDSVKDPVRNETDNSGEGTVESLHSGSRRDNSSESDREGSGENKLAENNNSESEGLSKDGD